jgi:hypothetical protein
MNGKRKGKPFISSGSDLLHCRCDQVKTAGSRQNRFSEPTVIELFNTEGESAKLSRRECWKRR